MNKSRRSPHIFIFAITMLVTLPSPSPVQQVRVLISGGFSAAYQGAERPEIAQGRWECEMAFRSLASNKKPRQLGTGILTGQ